MHVDAYRLSTFDELDDLDLDATVADPITVVEWGQGIAEGLAEDRLEIDIWTSPADFSAADDDDERVVTIRAVGSQVARMSISACCAVTDHGEADHD